MENIKDLMYVENIQVI